MVADYNDLFTQAIEAKKRQDKSAALTLFEKAMECDPKQFQAYFEAGVICKDLKRFDEAIDFFDQALSIKPTDTSVLVQKASCLRFQGDYQSCLNQLLGLVEKNPINWNVFFEIGLSFKGLNQFEDAQSWLQKGLAIAPNNLNILLELAHLARLQNNRELAYERFLTIIQLHPAHVGGYLEVATELKLLGRPAEAYQWLQYPFVRSRFNTKIFENKMFLLFEMDSVRASYELMLYARSYEIPVTVIHALFKSILSKKQLVEINCLSSELLISLLVQPSFKAAIISYRETNSDYLQLLTYFETFISRLLTDNKHKQLVDDYLFYILVIFFARDKKSEMAKQYILDNVARYIVCYPLNILFEIVSSIMLITNDDFTLSAISKGAEECCSINCLFICLVMQGHYPRNDYLNKFNDKQALIRILKANCNKENEPILKNIFLHLLQRGVFSFIDIEALYPDGFFLTSLKNVFNAIEPTVRANKKIDQSKKLKVALCISGQLRGYKDAYETVKESLIKELNPDVFVHTWKYVGFKEPVPLRAERVFSGNFLRAYTDLFRRYKFTYPEVKEKLSGLFRLLDHHIFVTEEELKEFYQTDYVVVEDDTTGEFVSFDNQQKMFYKINACNELMKTAQKDYDLVIRLRPDLCLHKMEGSSWGEIANFVNEENAVLLPSHEVNNLNPFVTIKFGKYLVGDIFAIGNEQSMAYYGSLLNLNSLLFENGFWGFLEDTYLGYSHTLLANGLFIGGYKCAITASKVPIQYGHMLGIKLKNPKDILLSIQNHLPDLDEEVSTSLVSALNKDIDGIAVTDITSNIKPISDAAYWFEKAIATTPNNIHTLSQSGLFYLLMGERDLALKRFEGIVQDQSWHIQSSIEVAAELKALGKHAEAYHWLQFAFVRSKFDKRIFEEKMLLLFEIDSVQASYELMLYSGSYEIPNPLVQMFFKCILFNNQMVKIEDLPADLLLSLVRQSSFEIAMNDAKANIEQHSKLSAYFNNGLKLEQDAKGKFNLY